MTDPTGPKMGWEGFLQIKPSSTWVDVKYVADTVNFSDTVGKEDAETRADGGNKTYEPGSFDSEITLKMQKRAGDAAFTAIQAAFRTRAPLLVRHADQDPAVVGADVYSAWMKVFSFSPAQPISGIQTWDVTLAPCPAGDVVPVVPERTTTSGS
jgi:hypothetical protein